MLPLLLVQEIFPGASQSTEAPTSMLAVITTVLFPPTALVLSTCTPSIPQFADMYICIYCNTHNTDSILKPSFSDCLCTGIIYAVRVKEILLNSTKAISIPFPQGELPIHIVHFFFFFFWLHFVVLICQEDEFFVLIILL